MDHLEIANSPIMWLAAAVVVGWVLFQSAVFIRKSLKMRKELGISDEQLRSAVKTSITSSIGPSTVILVGMVSLLVALGGPIAWYRLATIGSVAFELMAAGFAAEAVGVTLGGPDMNAYALSAALWVATLASLGWIIFTGLFTDKMDRFRNVLAGGKKALIPIVAAGAMSGAFGFLALDRVRLFNSQTAAAIGGFVIMYLFVTYNKKGNKKWIREWAFTISMFLGMIVSIPFI